MPFRKIACVIWLLTMGAVTVLALLPIAHLQLPVFNRWDKAQHAFAFVVLTGGALLLWPGASARVVIGMIAYGAGIELAQWAVGWRFAEWSDLAADTVGVVGLGCWCVECSFVGRRLLPRHETCAAPGMLDLKAPTYKHDASVQCLRSSGMRWSSGNSAGRWIAVEVYF